MVMDRVATHFDERAPSYDANIVRVIPAYQDLHAMTLAHLQHALPKEAHVLIAGAGTGTELAYFSQTCAQWHFTGVDPSAGMLALARERLAAQDKPARVTLETGYVSDLSADLRFDAATLLLVLHFVPDDGSKAALLQSIAARLKSDAPFIVADLCIDPNVPDLMERFAVWRHYEVLQGLPPKTAAEHTALASERIQYISEDRLRALLYEAGFAPPDLFYKGLLFSGWITRRR